MAAICSTLFVVSAPSGTGKTTIIKHAKQRVPTLTLSVSHTTRSPRVGEIDGVDYFFVSKEVFERMIEDHAFIEWARVHDNYYGTSRGFIDDARKAGKIVILDIDVQGAMQLKEIEDLAAVFIFIVPPSIEELTKRLELRGTEDQSSLKKRIFNADKELTYKDKYDHVVINDRLDDAIDTFVAIITEGNSAQSS